MCIDAKAVFETLVPLVCDHRAVEGGCVKVGGHLERDKAALVREDVGAERVQRRCAERELHVRVTPVVLAAPRQVQKDHVVPEVWSRLGILDKVVTDHHCLSVCVREERKQ